MLCGRCHRGNSPECEFWRRRKKAPPVVRALRLLRLSTGPPVVLGPSKGAPIAGNSGPAFTLCTALAGGLVVVSFQASQAGRWCWAIAQLVPVVSAYCRFVLASKASSHKSCRQKRNRNRPPGKSPVHSPWSGLELPATGGGARKDPMGWDSAVRGASDQTTRSTGGSFGPKGAPGANGSGSRCIGVLWMNSTMARKAASYSGLPAPLSSLRRSLLFSRS